MPKVHIFKNGCGSKQAQIRKSRKIGANDDSESLCRFLSIWAFSLLARVYYCCNLKELCILAECLYLFREIDTEKQPLCP
jgi:hypothetical protein